ncbi:MAG: hypothetical protein KKF67_00795 [Nanoarchaeota archaeon]|nr:hypothetical protein [Nanoarchaeota archaeon]
MMSEYSKAIKVDDLTLEKIKRYLGDITDETSSLGLGVYYHLGKIPFKRIRVEGRSNIVQVGNGVSQEVIAGIERMTKQRVVF